MSMIRSVLVFMMLSCGPGNPCGFAFIGSHRRFKREGRSAGRRLRVAWLGHGGNDRHGR